MGRLAKKAKSTLCEKNLSTLPLCLKIKDEIDQDMSTEACTVVEEEICKLLYDLKVLSDCDTASALKCIKAISAWFNNGTYTFPDVIQRTLVRYFIIANAGTPLKRAIVSNLDGITEDDVRKKIQGLFSNFLVEFLHSVTSDHSVEIGRHAIDLVSTCLSSFTLGTEVIHDKIHDVLIFLRFFLESLTSNCQTSSDTDCENDLAATLKCTTLILKKCTNFKESDRDVLETLLFICRNVLATGAFGWDTNNAAGMTWVMVWRNLYKGSDLLTKIANTINELSKTTHSSLNVEKDVPRATENLQVSTGLSFCNGVIVTLRPDALVQPLESDNNQKCLALHYLLPYLKWTDQRCKTISEQVILMKCFVQWTYIVLGSTKTDISSFIRNSLLEEKDGRSIIGDLVCYALNKLEHPTDAIRHQANETLVNMLDIATNLGVQSFSKSLVENVLSHNWRKRSTFIALNCVLERVSPETVLKSSTGITYKLLEAIKHHSLAPYASESYKILAHKSLEIKKTLPAQQMDSLCQFDSFIEPLLTVMCNCTEHSLRLLIDYCFLKILKVYGSGCIAYIFNSFESKLSSSAHNLYFQGNTQTLAAFLACLKITVSNGYIKDKVNMIKESKYRDLLRSSMVHESHEVRHLGFALLCESVKRSNLISFETLDALKYALPYNVSCQDSAFRQRLLNSLKRLFLQLKGNMTNLKKTQCREKHKNIDLEVDKCLYVFEEFIIWMGEFTVAHLYPSAPYAKRITCISILTLIVGMFIDSECHLTLNFSRVFTPHAVQSLFVLLSDPYEDVQKFSFSLLKNGKLKNFITAYMSRDYLLDMFAKALERASKCTMPEFCGDAAFHMKLYAALSNNRSSKHSEVLSICSKLLDVLHESIDFAYKNLYLAATTSPMYGVLHCLKSLLQSVEFRELEKDYMLQWRQLISSAVLACFRVCGAVLPVVGSVSPEGHMPDVEQSPVNEVDGGTDDAWNDLPDILKSLILGGNDIDGQDERKTRALAQQVLVCCWRSAKESSLLLQEVTSSRFPVASSKNSFDGILSREQLLDVGEHLRKQLMEARHRGAFEIAYYAFKAYCPRLWNAEYDDLNSVPEKWLQTTLSDIKDPTRSKELCATRRSAGLPFVMKALLSGNKTAKGKRHLHDVMTSLLYLCEVPNTTGVISKVHGLNILRGLVNDASLGEETLPYVSECMQVSLTGFSSPIWAVRNSSTLLFSALFTRIFGVKRDKTDDFSMKNRLSGNEFFSRLQGLHSFLLKQLEQICNNLNKGGHDALSPALHPILLLLSRIYPSTMQPTTGIGLGDFVPLLIRCRASAVYKSRVATAAALATVLSWNQRVPVLKNCCDNFIKDLAVVQGKRDQEAGIASSPQNRVHGGLLQILEIIRCCVREDQQISDNLSESVGCIVSSVLIEALLFLSSRRNNCPLTRATSLEVFLLIHGELAAQLDKDVEHSWQELVENIKISSIAELEDANARSLPGYNFLINACANAAFLLSNRQEILFLVETVLSAGNADIIAAVLDVLSSHWDAVERKLASDDYQLLETHLVNTLLRDTYTTEITTSIYLMLSKISSSLSCQRLLQHSVNASRSCSAAQSSLHQALIKFQSSCIKHVSKESELSRTGVFENWITMLSSAARCFENTDDVRFAVANSLLHHAFFLDDHDGLLGPDVVRLWSVLFDLLCDEESEVRKVACTITYETSKKISIGGFNSGQPLLVSTTYKICLDRKVIFQQIGTPEDALAIFSMFYVFNVEYPEGLAVSMHFLGSHVSALSQLPHHPCVDTLALLHAIVTLILTHGRKYLEPCQRALQSLIESECTTVPITAEVAGSDGNVAAQELLPGLFERSEANTYLDSREVSRIAKIGLAVLKDGNVDLDAVSLLRKFQSDSHLN